MEERQKRYFPLFVSLEQKKIVVVGAGKIALRRIRTLQSFCHSIRVIAKALPRETKEAVCCLQREGVIELCVKAFEETDLDGAVDLVLAATDDRQLNGRIAAICKERGIPVNVASDRTLCDFFFPAVIENERVVIGIAGDGTDHRLVAHTADVIREFLEEKKQEQIK